MPEIVPPVPMPATKCVILPAVCSHSSGPVVRVVRSSGFAGLWYWFMSTAPGRSVAMRLRHASSRTRAIRARPRSGLSTTSAPNAFEQVHLLARDLVGHAEHRAIALAPPRPSRAPGRCCPTCTRRCVPPGFRRPSRSAASTMARPMRSLTLPPGLKASSLARTGPETRARASGSEPAVCALHNRERIRSSEPLAEP